MEGHRGYPDDSYPDGRDAPWYSGDRAYPDQGGYRPAGGYAESGGYGEQGTGAYGEHGAGGYGEQGTGGYGGGFAEPPRGPRSGEPLPPVADSRSDPLTGDLPADSPAARYHAEPIDLSALRRPPTQAPVSGQPAGAQLGQPAGGTPQAGPTQPVGVPAPAGPTQPVGAPTAPYHPLAGHDTGPLTTVPPPVGPAMGAAGAAGGAGVYRTRRTGFAVALAAATVVLEVPVLRVFLDVAWGSPVVPGPTVASLLMMIALPLFAFGLYAALGGAAAAPGAGGRVWARTPLAYLPVALILFVAAALAAR